MIKILNDDTIQKIAAGEVVERPVSIIKELVENSIDAGADDIIVEIKNGGKSYIKVSDNGSGIKSDEIELAFTRHATSKIENFNDLYKIFSMGFRGEALASIISVSNVKLVTKTNDEKIGTQVIYENGVKIETKSVGTNTGTFIEVSDLFKHVPARYKFLSSDITEGNKITQLMYTYAIGHTDISITYIKDDKEMFSTNKNNDKKSNFEILFGREFVKNSGEIKSESQNYKILGVISNNRYYKGNRSMQFVFVNGRYIENEEITASIEKAYNNLIPNGRFPVFELNISVDPDLIDVNIHPNKQKIKFSFSEELSELIVNTAMNFLYDTQSEKKVETENKIDTKISFHKLNDGDEYKRILDSYKESFTLQNESITEDSLQKKAKYSDIHFNTLYTEDDENKKDSINIFEDSFKYKTKEEDIREDTVEQLSFDMDRYIFRTVLFNKFILFEDTKDVSIQIIDINRANTRIIFENLEKKISIFSQDLLEPIIVNLTKKEIEQFNQNKENFEEVGYNADVFGEDKIIIRSIPYYLGEPSTEIDFKMLLDNVNKTEDSKHFMRKSVSLAISKSKNINEKDAILLYKELNNTENPYTDPNGNTIIYNISKEHFEKFLKG